MTQTTQTTEASQTVHPDLFQLGQDYFNRFLKEFAGYGIKADPGIELRRGSGMLCYYSLEDRHIYLSVPDLNTPIGRLQAMFFRSLLGCQTNDELLYFFRLFIPHIIAHELTHHFRQRYDLFDADNLWHEEQIANKLAVAVVKHRRSPAEKETARKFLRGAIDTLSQQIEQKEIASDSYYSVLHAMNVSGDLGVSDFEQLEMLQASLGVSGEAFLEGSGQVTDDFLARLDQRDELIDSINEQYTQDQIKYIYYHLGWLYLDLTSRETEYVDEFGRNYLNLGDELLPVIHAAGEQSTTQALQACFKAYQQLQGVGARYFYKRYRALLLAMLQKVELAVTAHNDRLKREATLILESWNEEASDMLDYLSQLAPAHIRPFFPHLIADNIDAAITLPDSLPTETDRRLWQHLGQHKRDKAAANTMYRLTLLDQTDLYRPLPVEPLLELVHHLSVVKFAADEAVIWENERNDDVYFLTQGHLTVTITRDGQSQQIGEITPGQMFGEIAFFTEDPRYATVRATEPSQCFVLTDADLQLLAYRHPTILMRMASALAKRLTLMYDLGRNEMV